MEVGSSSLPGDANVESAPLGMFEMGKEPKKPGFLQRIGVGGKKLEPRKIGEGAAPGELSPTRTCWPRSGRTSSPARPGPRSPSASTPTRSEFGGSSPPVDAMIP